MAWAILIPTIICWLSDILHLDIVRFYLLNLAKAPASKGQEDVTEVKLKCGPGLAGETRTADNVAVRTGTRTCGLGVSDSGKVAEGLGPTPLPLIL